MRSRFARDDNSLEMNEQRRYFSRSRVPVSPLEKLDFETPKINIPTADSSAREQDIIENLSREIRTQTRIRGF